MSITRIKRDDQPDLSFDGEMIANTESSPDQGMEHFSGSLGHWEELELYRTKGGKFVCARSGLTQWDGQTDSHEAAVVKGEKDVIDFFGHDHLAKEVYEQAGIDASEVVN